mgnify:CR=1 FL=1
MQNTEELQRIIGNIENRYKPQSLTRDIELTEEQQAIVDNTVEEVRENGYCYIENFLSPQEVETLREDLEPIFAIVGNRVNNTDTGWKGTQTVHIPNLFGRTRAADEIAIHPMLLKIVRGVLGPLFQMSAATAMCPGPGAEAQGFHQDDGHWPIPRPHVPLCCNTFIALDDFTPENGATRIVPGSHKLAEANVEDPDYIHLEMPAGSLGVWDGALVHAGGPNTTKDQIRRTLNLNYNLSWLRQQENQYLGVPRKTLLEMPERLQRILGYQRVNMLAGGVDYQDPLDYLRAIEEG